MSVQIPLSFTPQAAGLPGTPSAGLQLQLPVAFLGGAVSLGSAQGRRGQVFRAVAAAVSLRLPAEALKTAKAAKESPEIFVDPGAVDTAKLNLLLDACTRVLDDRSTAPAAEARHRAVARAVGADPVLVAAVSIVDDDEAHKNGVKWIAMSDGDLLDRAARAGAKEYQLDLVPTPVGRIERLEQDVKTLDARVKKLEPPASKKGASP